MTQEPDRCCHDVYESFHPVFWVQGVRWWIMYLQIMRCVYCGYQQVYHGLLEQSAPLRSEKASEWIEQEKLFQINREKEMAAK